MFKPISRQPGQKLLHYWGLGLLENRVREGERTSNGSIYSLWKLTQIGWYPALSDTYHFRHNCSFFYCIFLRLECIPLYPPQNADSLSIFHWTSAPCPASSSAQALSTASERRTAPQRRPNGMNGNNDDDDDDDPQEAQNCISFNQLVLVDAFQPDLGDLGSTMWGLGDLSLGWREWPRGKGGHFELRGSWASTGSHQPIVTICNYSNHSNHIATHWQPQVLDKSWTPSKLLGNIIELPTCVDTFRQF